MTPEELAAIRERMAEITEWPWVAEYSGEQGNCVIPHDAQSTREAVCVTRLYHQGADAEFIAHAPADIDALLAEVERLRAGQAEAAAMLNDAADVMREQSAEVDRLRNWLTDAITDISDWGAYAGDYFQEKWDLQGTLRQYRDALDGTEVCTCDAGFPLRRSRDCGIAAHRAEART